MLRPWNMKLKGWAHFQLRQADRKKAKEPPPKVDPCAPVAGITVHNGIFKLKPLAPDAKVAGKAFDNGYSFRRALEKKGFKVLGGGNFSTVLGHPDSDRVIKVTTNLTDNWLDYVVWGSQNGYAGTLTPNVFSYKRHKGTDHAFAVAVMEKMDKTLGHVDWMSDHAVVMDLFHKAAAGNLMAKLLLEEVSPGLGSFSSALKNTFHRSLDLHGGNLMVRKDGTICVTDPVANHSSLAHINRLRVNDFTTVQLPNVVAVNDNEQENCHADYRSFY